MRVRPLDQLQRWYQVGFGIYEECDVAGFGRPAMRARFAFGQDSLLVIGVQANIAMAWAMDVHEHRASDKERVFVNTRVRAFCDVW